MNYWALVCHVKDPYLRWAEVHPLFLPFLEICVEAGWESATGSLGPCQPGEYFIQHSLLKTVGICEARDPGPAPFGSSVCHFVAVPRVRTHTRRLLLLPEPRKPILLALTPSVFLAAGP